MLSQSNADGERGARSSIMEVSPPCHCFSVPTPFLAGSDEEEEGGPILLLQCLGGAASAFLTQGRNMCSTRRAMGRAQRGYGASATCPCALSWGPSGVETVGAAQPSSPPPPLLLCIIPARHRAAFFRSVGSRAQKLGKESRHNRVQQLRVVPVRCFSSAPRVWGVSNPFFLCF